MCISSDTDTNIHTESGSDADTDTTFACKNDSDSVWGSKTFSDTDIYIDSVTMFLSLSRSVKHS